MLYKSNLLAVLVIGTIFLKCTTPIYAQNLVQNSGFESGQANQPTGDNQFSKCATWISFETPDWYTTQNFNSSFKGRCNQGGNIWSVTGGIINSAHSGDYYAGFGSCEGVEIQLSRKTLPSSIVRVNFWVMPRGKKNTNIYVYLLKEPKTKADNNICTNPITVGDFKLLKIVNINSESSSSLPFYECNTWQKIDLDWEYVEEEYEYLLIKGDNSEPGRVDIGDERYMYIDAIQLENINLCDHACGPQSSEVVFHQIANVMTPNGDGINDQWAAIVSNGVRYEFIIKNRNGITVFSKKGAIPNGMNRYCISWEGQYLLSPDIFGQNGTLVLDGPYKYILDVYNCHNEKTSAASNLTVLGSSGSPTFLPPDIYNTPYFVSDCENCSYELHLKDLIIENDVTYSAATILSLENVVIKPGVHVIFNAGNEIQFLNGFNAEIGSIVETNLKPCKISGTNQLCRVQEIPESSDTIASKSNLSISKDVNNLEESNELKTVQDNLANNITLLSQSDYNLTISYLLTEKTSVNLQVYDLIGKKIQTVELNKSKEAGTYILGVPMNNLSKGIYILSLSTNRGNEYLKIIKP